MISAPSLIRPGETITISSLDRSCGPPGRPAQPEPYVWFLGSGAPTGATLFPKVSVTRNGLWTFQVRVPDDAPAGKVQIGADCRPPATTDPELWNFRYTALEIDLIR